MFANEPMESPSVVASTLANKPVGTDSSFNSVSMPIVPSEQTRKTTSSEDRRNGGTTSNTLTSDLIIPGSLKSSKKGDVPGSSVGNQIFSSVSIMEPSRSNMELPPAVEPIRSTNKPLWTPKSKPDTSKGYAHRYSVPPMVPLSFNAKSTTSKGVSYEAFVTSKFAFSTSLKSPESKQRIRGWRNRVILACRSATFIPAEFLTSTLHLLMWSFPSGHCIGMMCIIN